MELVKIEGKVDHAKAFGRIAFSCDRKEVRNYFHELHVHEPTFSPETGIINVP